MALLGSRYLEREIKSDANADRYRESSFREVAEAGVR